MKNFWKKSRPYLIMFAFFIVTGLIYPMQIWSFIIGMVSVYLFTSLKTYFVFKDNKEEFYELLKEIDNADEYDDTLLDPSDLEQYNLFDNEQPHYTVHNCASGAECCGKCHHTDDGEQSDEGNDD